MAALPLVSPDPVRVAIGRAVGVIFVVTAIAGCSAGGAAESVPSSRSLSPSATSSPAMEKSEFLREVGHACSIQFDTAAELLADVKTTNDRDARLLDSRLLMQDFRDGSRQFADLAPHAPPQMSASYRAQVVGPARTLARAFTYLDRIARTGATAGTPSPARMRTMLTTSVKSIQRFGRRHRIPDCAGSAFTGAVFK